MCMSPCLNIILTHTYQMSAYSSVTRKVILQKHNYCATQNKRYVSTTFQGSYSLNIPL